MSVGATNTAADTSVTYSYDTFRNTCAKNTSTVFFLPRDAVLAGYQYEILSARALLSARATATHCLLLQ